MHLGVASGECGQWQSTLLRDSSRKCLQFDMFEHWSVLASVSLCPRTVSIFNLVLLINVSANRFFLIAHVDMS